MKNYLKGIIIGIGGIAPGLSGSVLLVIFGLYQRTINAIGTVFRDFKNNVRFLVPLMLGILTGILLFSKVIDFFLANFEAQTRFAFLGLILGTVPLFYKQVKKEGFSKKYYIYIVAAFIFGILFFSINKGSFTQIEDPSLMQSIFLGIAVAGSSIIPGVDSAVILSSFGLYELYVNSLATVDFRVLIPAAGGLVIGVLVFSFLINKLIYMYYTATFSIIFGLFIAIIPNILNRSCILHMDAKSVICIILMIAGFFLSYYLEDIRGNNKKLKEFVGRLKK